MSLLGRRRFLIVVPASALALACGKDKPTCKEPPNAALTEDEKTLRGGVGYKHIGADPKRLCADCVYYVAGESCGTCEMMPGPTNPGGTCNLFRQKD